MSHPIEAELNGKVTELLDRWAREGPDVLHELLPAVYQELRRLASGHLARQAPGTTLQPTVLVHEAYLHFARHRAAPFVNRKQFFAFASRVIRHILVDHIRGRLRNKRGGISQDLSWEEVGEFAEPSTEAGLDAETLLGIDQVLARLEESDPQQARIVELRFFAGLTHSEIAEVLEISIATVERHWRVGKRRLARQLETKD